MFKGTTPPDEKNPVAEWTTWEEAQREIFTTEEISESDRRVARIGERLVGAKRMPGIVRWFMFRIVWPIQDRCFDRMMANTRKRYEHD